MAYDREEQVLLRVRGGVNGMWTPEVLFDHFGVMYLASGWKRFCRVHQIRVRHFLVFNYDEKYKLTISVFDETMYHRHYTPAALANSHGLLFVYVLLHVSKPGMQFFCNNQMQCKSHSTSIKLITSDQKQLINKILAGYDAGGDRATKPHCTSRDRIVVVATSRSCTACAS
jgi:hypothetical protein